MDKENKVTNRVSLAPSDWELFLDEATKIGDPGNRSAGLRAIIAKYRRLAVGASPVEMSQVAASAAYTAAVEAQASPEVASAVYTAVVQAMRKFMEEGR